MDIQTHKIFGLTRIGLSFLAFCAEFVQFLQFLGNLALTLKDCLLQREHFSFLEFGRNLFDYGPRYFIYLIIISALPSVALTLLANSQLGILGGTTYLANMMDVFLGHILAPIMTALFLIFTVNNKISKYITSTFQRPPMVDLLQELTAIIIMAVLLYIWVYFVSFFSSIFVVVHLGQSFSLYLNNLRAATVFDGFLLGMFKGFIFGIIVGLVSTFLQYNLRKTVGKSIMTIMLTSIVWIILVNAVLEIWFASLNI